jgi:heptosyltransferase I
MVAPREILIVMLSALGDAVHVLPVVNALKRAWPESRITWVIHRFRMSSSKITRPWMSSSFSSGEKARKQSNRIVISAADFAGVISTCSSICKVYLKAGLITKLAPADVKTRIRSAPRA